MFYAFLSYLHRKGMRLKQLAQEQCRHLWVINSIFRLFYFFNGNTPGFSPHRLHTGEMREFIFVKLDEHRTSDSKYVNSKNFESLLFEITLETQINGKVNTFSEHFAYMILCIQKVSQCLTSMKLNIQLKIDNYVKYSI